MCYKYQGAIPMLPPHHFKTIEQALAILGDIRLHSWTFEPMTNGGIIAKGDDSCSREIMW